MFIRTVFATILALSFSSYAEAAADYETFFDRLEKAYVVGEIELMTPLEYRDGKLLAFPARIVDTAYAKRKNVRTIMFVHEVGKAQQASPFTEGAKFFAMIRTLPKYSYWKDNLPKTAHYALIGGTRHVFRGSDKDTAMNIARHYAASFEEPVPKKNYSKSAAVVLALRSDVAVLRSDAAQTILRNSRITRFMSDETKQEVISFVETTDDEGALNDVVEAAGKWKLAFLEGSLEKLSSRDDATGAGALAALEAMGQPRPIAGLTELTKASSSAVRAYAYGELAERASATEAWTASAGILVGEEPADVRAAVTAGLGRSKSEGAIGPLTKALERGDAVSRDAANALAVIATPEAISVLTAAVVNGANEAKIGSVVALSQIPDCRSCVEFLSEQYEAHPEEPIKDLIGMVTGRPKPHEH